MQARFQEAVVDEDDAFDESECQHEQEPYTGNVEILVCPTSSAMPEALLSGRHLTSDVRWVDVRSVLSQEQETIFVSRCVNLCGQVNVGKSTIAGVFCRIWPDRVRLFPEWKVETQRPLRKGEKRGKDVRLYPTEADFLKDVERGKFFVAYQFRRSLDHPWQLAGYHMSDVREVANGEFTYLTVINGLVWDILRHAMVGLHGFWVSSPDINQFKEQRRSVSYDGDGLNEYGVADRYGRVLSVMALPNPWLRNPKRDLFRKFSDPQVKCFLESVLFWKEYVALAAQRVADRSQAGLEHDLDYITEVLWGLREPTPPECE